MAELTPMMRQYMEIKEQNPDSILFFRLGDFYEMFGPDARTASRELDLALTTKHIKCETSVPAGEVFVDGSGVGEVGAVVLNDRKLLAEDGMVVIVLPMSSHDHQLLCPPEIVTRGFVYVKESEELLETLRRIATDTVDGMSAKKRRDDGDVCRAVRSAVSSYLYKTTKRSPMIIPMVTKL